MRLIPLAATAVFLLAGAPNVLAQGTEQVEIRVEEAAGGVYMLKGRGGNIGVSAGEDGVFLVDDQYAPLTDAIVEAVRRISEEPIRFVINTHWHGDHTGGNENLAKRGVVVIAHDNVHKRMSSDHFNETFGTTTAAAPEAARPIISFDSELTFHMNGDTIRAFHVEPAHTDGDAVVHFENANVIHAGDIYFNGLFPFIDTSSGGSVDGVIAAAGRVLDMSDDETVIIPGHGPLSNKAELTVYRDMLVTVSGRIKALIAEGKSLEEVVAADPTEEFNYTWGNGFLPTERWVPLIYKALGGQ